MIIKKCKKCGKVTEMIKRKEHSQGYDNTYYECSNCGYIEKQQINTVHYGNDEYKR